MPVAFRLARLPGRHCASAVSPAIAGSAWRSTVARFTAGSRAQFGAKEAPWGTALPWGWTRSAHRLLACCVAAGDHAQGPRRHGCFRSSGERAGQRFVSAVERPDADPGCGPRLLGRRDDGAGLLRPQWAPSRPLQVPDPRRRSALGAIRTRDTRFTSGAEAAPADAPPLACRSVQVDRRDLRGHTVNRDGSRPGRAISSPLTFPRLGLGRRGRRRHLFRHVEAQAGNRWREQR